MKRPVRYIISLFGDRHINMLLPLLFSIEKNASGDAISVYWEDIKRETITLLSKAFPFVEWVETDFHFSSDTAKRISSKVLVWNRAATEKQMKNEWLVFLDADTLVIRTVAPLLETISADVVLTYREERFPINSGVIAIQSGKNGAEFFSLWKEKTLSILETPDEYRKANDGTLPYGGADQMSLHHLLHYNIKQKNYHVPVQSGIAEIFLARCEDMNETLSAPITSRTHIIHYKGGWRTILFENALFTKNRPKQASWDMFLTYHQYMRDAILALKNRTGHSFSPRDFGLVTPPYLNTVTWKERRWLYPICFIFGYIGSLPKRIWNLREKLFT
jgi:hypothetical protein